MTNRQHLNSLSNNDFMDAIKGLINQAGEHYIDWDKWLNSEECSVTSDFFKGERRKYIKQVVTTGSRNQEEKIINKGFCIVLDKRMMMGNLYATIYDIETKNIYHIPASKILEPSES